MARLSRHVNLSRKIDARLNREEGLEKGRALHTRQAYTKGAWVARMEAYDRDGGIPIACADGTRVATADVRFSADADEFDPHRREQFANANLIASAPELLAALNGMLAHSDSWNVIETADGDIARARAAIAKAEGR